MIRFYCFINDKIIRSPKNLDLDIIVAKNGQFHVFFRGKQQIPCQTANSVARHESVLQNTAGPGDGIWALHIKRYARICMSKR